MNLVSPVTKQHKNGKASNFKVPPVYLLNEMVFIFLSWIYADLGWKISKHIKFLMQFQYRASQVSQSTFMSRENLVFFRSDNLPQSVEETLTPSFWDFWEMKALPEPTARSTSLNINQLESKFFSNSIVVVHFEVINTLEFLIYPDNWSSTAFNAQKD